MLNYNILPNFLPGVLGFQTRQWHQYTSNLLSFHFDVQAFSVFCVFVHILLFAVVLIFDPGYRYTQGLVHIGAIECKTIY